MKPEEFEVYVIPPNFMEGGTLFGGLLKTRNTIEAVILGLAVGVPVLHLPFSLTVRVVILCLTALPLVLLALIGVSGMSLSAFIRLFFCFLHNRRILSRDGTQGGKNGKTLLPSWAQQRKSDCEAEDPPLPKSRSRFSVDLKQRSVTQFKTFLQEEEAVQPLNALADYIPIEKIEHGVIYTRDHRYYPSSSYEDVYSSRYNYGGKNVVDYQIPKLEYGQFSTTQTGVMEKIMLPGLQGISASGGDIYEISPGGGTVEIPGFLQGGSTATPATPAFTELTQDFLLSNGAVGKISIPAIGVKNYYLWEGETTASMKKGLGHFTSTSVWNGNVAVCGHNRGAKYVIGSIKDLDVGDKITYTTSMGTRTYLVETVTKISSSDWSYLSSTADNRITLFTCVAGDPSQRWCVQAVQAS